MTHRPYTNPTDTARHLAAVRAETELLIGELRDIIRDDYVCDYVGATRRCEQCGEDAAYRLIVAFTGDPTDMWECELCAHITGLDDIARAVVTVMALRDIGARFPWEQL